MEPEAKRYRRTKIAPERPAGGPNDIWYSRSSNAASMARRARRLLENGETVTVHGLGAALAGAATLAVRVRDAFPPGRVAVHTTTSSVALADEVTVKGEEEETIPEMCVRINSAIHLRLQLLPAQAAASRTPSPAPPATPK
eukprot:m51a1_g9004 hypothetical protein (141) ;mRNA; f:118475-118897